MAAIKKINTKLNEIWIDEEGFLVVKTMEGVELDLDEVKACYEAYKSLGIGPHNKVFQLMYVIDGAMTLEARTYAAENIKDYALASAVISNSLAVRLVVNFLNKFYQMEVPFKMFSNDDDARKWIKTFKDKK